MVLRGERTGMEKRFFELCERVIPEQGLELYDLDYLPGSGELRVFIRNPQTQTAQLEDCMRVDRALSPSLEEDWTPEKLTLEVSSPGLFRPLRTVAHFQETVGEMVSLQLAQKLEDEGLSKATKSTKKIVALLKEVAPEGIKIELEGQVVSLAFDQIKKANLETDLSTKRDHE